VIGKPVGVEVAKLGRDPERCAVDPLAQTMFIPVWRATSLISRAFRPTPAGV
jgi:hypothetical protein